jgi:hypothetical protein
MPIPAPANAQPTTTTAGFRCHTAVAMREASAIVRPSAPSRAAIPLRIPGNRPCTHDAPDHVSPAAVSASPAIAADSPYWVTMISGT